MGGLVPPFLFSPTIFPVSNCYALASGILEMKKPQLIFFVVTCNNSYHGLTTIYDLNYPIYGRMRKISPKRRFLWLGKVTLLKIP
jgi:hypothetical protein